MLDEQTRCVSWANRNLATVEATGNYVWVRDDDDLCCRPQLIVELKEIAHREHRRLDFCCGIFTLMRKCMPMGTVAVQESPKFEAVGNASVRRCLFATAMLLALTSSPVRADLVNIVSVNRSVSVSGSASITGGAPMSYSVSQNAAPFSVSGFANAFNPTNPTAVAHADSSASQSGNVSAAAFSFAQQFSCSWSTPIPLTLGGLAGAAAAVVFQISFTVTEPVFYQFTLAGSAFGGNSFAYSQQFELSGRTFAFGGVFSGLLLPGQTYVFTASQSFFGPPDFLGGAFFGNSNGQMQFTSVPEPRAFSYLLLGMFAVAVYSRRTQAPVAATSRSHTLTTRRRAG